MGRQNGEPLDEILQLSNISRPWVRHHTIYYFRREGLGRRRVFLRLEPEEMIQQQRDILPPLSQGREAQRNHVEAGKEIAAGFSGARPPLQVLVAGRNNPNVHFDLLVPPRRVKVSVSTALRNLAWVPNSSSPISSRKRVPPCADSKWPILR